MFHVFLLSASQDIGLLTSLSIICHIVQHGKLTFSSSCYYQHPLYIPSDLLDGKKSRTHQAGNQRQVHFYPFWKCSHLSTVGKQRRALSLSNNTRLSGTWTTDTHQIKFSDHLRGLGECASACSDRPDRHMQFPLDRFWYVRAPVQVCDFPSVKPNYS